MAAKDLTNVDLESATLGSMISDPSTIADVLDHVRPDDFSLLRHQVIAQSILDLHTAGDPIDPLTIVARAKHNGHTVALSALTALAAVTPTAIHGVYYAKQVAHLAQRRRMVAVAARIEETAHDTGVSDIAAAAEALIGGLRDERDRQSFKHVEDALTEYLDDLDRIMEHGPAGIQTGLADFDRITGGLQRGHFIVLGARPAVGKTACALSIIHGVVWKNPDARVALFSLEMGMKQIAQRLLCIDGSINSSHLLTGTVSEDEFARLIQSAATLSRKHIFINDDAQINTAQLRSELQRLSRDGPVDLVVIDYLQLMHHGSGGGDNRVLELTRITRDLKAIARDFDVPLLALAQVSRSVEQRKDKRPLPSDLRESGSVEQDSDLVLFLYRDIVYNPDTDDPNLAELNIGKNRHGPGGTIELFFNETSTRFTSLAKDRPVASGWVSGPQRSNSPQTTPQVSVTTTSGLDDDGISIGDDGDDIAVARQELQLALGMMSDDIDEGEYG